MTKDIDNESTEKIIMILSPESWMILAGIILSTCYMIFLVGYLFGKY